jgi:RES domain-containing protein
MDVYRLVKLKYSNDPFSSIGSEKYGGRWNSVGKKMIYAAESVSLSMLEVMVHVQSQDLLMNKYQLFSISIPDMLILNSGTDNLPIGWNDRPASIVSAQFGDAWLDSQDSLALVVPSVIAPYSYNLLLNAEHSQWNQILTSVSKIDFEFDPRLAPDT